MCGRGFPASDGSFMADDSEPQVPLESPSVTLQNGDRRRFRCERCHLDRARKAPRVAYVSGPQGSVMIDLTRVEFWRLTSKFHEESAAVDFGDAKQLGRRSRRKRS